MNDPLGMMASLERIQFRPGDVIAPSNNLEARLTLIERTGKGWRVKQMNGRRAHYSLNELGRYEKVS